jgi:hypothetical protein
MGHGAAPEAAGSTTLEMLQEEFRRWRIFENDGIWRAMRTGTATTEGPRSLIHPALSAPSAEELGGLLDLQEWLLSLTPAQLEATWRASASKAPAEAVAL